MDLDISVLIDVGLVPATHSISHLIQSLCSYNPDKELCELCRPKDFGLKDSDFSLQERVGELGSLRAESLKLQRAVELHSKLLEFSRTKLSGVELLCFRADAGDAGALDLASNDAPSI